MRIISFEDVDDVFKYLRERTEDAATRVQPWQSELKPGDYYLRLVQEGDVVIAVYGEILEPEYDPEDGPNLYNTPSMRDYRFSRSFSVGCPSGELGDVHVSTVGKKLSPTQFNLAAQWGWPSDARVRKIVEME